MPAQPYVCTDDSLSAEWDGLRYWCNWTLEQDWAEYRADYGDCDTCVEEFQQAVTDLPLSYCTALFDCWATCAATEGPDQFAVDACIETYCDQLCG